MKYRGERMKAFQLSPFGWDLASATAWPGTHEPRCLRSPRRSQSGNLRIAWELTSRLRRLAL